MQFIILFVAVCFLFAFFRGDQEPKSQYVILSILCLIICVVYIFFEQL